MYQRLSEKESQLNYRKILNDTISILEKLIVDSPLALYQDIYSQLLDIKENVVERHIYTTEEEIDERYTLGGIAIKNFAPDSEIQQRLCDIFGGASDYLELPEII